MVKRRAFLPVSEENVVCKGELKPCPFCGSSRVFRHHIMSQNRFTVRCLECGITTPSFLDVKDAEKIWNKRTKDQ